MGSARFLASRYREKIAAAIVGNDVTLQHLSACTDSLRSLLECNIDIA